MKKNTKNRAKHIRLGNVKIEFITLDGILTDFLKSKLIVSYRDHLGNGYCDLNYNNEDNFFDVGDCCLEDLQCRLKFYNFTNFVPRFCPENTCIKSNLFCIPEELGDGICQDHNNGPFCDYDLGDCCLTGGLEDLDLVRGTFAIEGPKNTTECCDCLCKANFNQLNQFLLSVTKIPDLSILG